MWKMKALTSISIICLLSYANYASCSEKPTVCTKLEHNICDQCHSFKDSFECLESLYQNETSMGVLSGEEFLFHIQKQNRTETSNLEIYGQFRDEDRDSDDNDYEVVVIVKKEMKDFKDLQNLRYCRGNFDKFQKISQKYKANAFEDLLLNQIQSSENDCSTDVLSEKDLCFLEDFLGKSCRMGSWVDDIEENENLTKKYDKLKALCSPETTNSEIFEITLEYFTKNCDIAVTTLKSSLKEKLQTQHFYLCNNFTTSKQPCHWYIQHWPTLVSNKFDRQKIKEEYPFAECYVTKDRKRRSTGGCELKEFLLPVDYSDKYRFKAKDPLQKFGEIPMNEASTLRHSIKVKWCTVSDEDLKKCRRMGSVADYLNIYPRIECLKRTSDILCLRAIKNGAADIFAAKQPIIRIQEAESLQKVAEIKLSLPTLYLIGNNKTLSELFQLKNKYGCAAKEYQEDITRYFLIYRWQDKEEWPDIHWSENENQVYRCLEENADFIITTNNTKKQDIVFNSLFGSPVFMRSGDKNIRNVQLMLESLEKLFTDRDTLFNGFGKFDNVDDVLFQRTSVGFQPIIISETKKDFIEETKDIDRKTDTTTSENNFATSPHTNLKVLIFCILLIV